MGEWKGGKRGLKRVREQVSKGVADENMSVKNRPMWERESR